MSAVISERLTRQFYEWEQRGRGWLLFDSPVALEPPFYPFFAHTVDSTVLDDSKRHTLVSKFISAFKQKEDATATDFEIPAIEPFAYLKDEPLVAMGIALPKGHKVESTEMEQLLCMLSATIYPVSFEIIATHLAIQIQVVCRTSDELLVKSQLKAYFPAAVLSNKGPGGLNLLEENAETYRVDFGLKDEFMRPLAVAKNFEPDPLTGLFGLLDALSDGQRGIIQILFSGIQNAWATSMTRAVTDDAGDSFFADDPDMPKLTKEKISAPLCAVCVRVVTQANTSPVAVAIAEHLSTALVKSAHSSVNALIPLHTLHPSEDGYLDDIYLRQSHRLGMLLNCRELATLVHLPAPSILSPKVERDTKKTKLAPEITQGHSFVLGTNYHQGIERIVTVPSSLRLRHTHIIGATGTGKSTFLQKIIMQDVEQGHGIAVLDPHGDLIDGIVSRIPENRVADVVLVDPSDAEFPIGFNILSAHSEIEKEILSSDLVATFRRLSTSWGDQMNSVFANAILAFLESSQGGTLSDLRRFLIEPAYRNTFLSTVTDSNIIYYWQKSFPLLKSGSLGPIITRLDAFLRPKLIRNMVVQQKGLDFENLMDTKKVVLIKLSQGLIGTENSYLLGTFFVSKIYQAALARQAKSKAERSDFFLYIDEFQNFITPSMSGILSGARKYHLGLILAHQDMQQLIKYDTELASSVIANPGTRICFRVGDIDAKKFEDGFSYFAARDLQDLKQEKLLLGSTDLITTLTYLLPRSLNPMPQLQREFEKLLFSIHEIFTVPPNQ
ncbi:MAG: type IV secretion system DNA-binding domain-containing protein [Bacteroidetes bacterium]|nr:type IV secretion system DNA-binding domain-containing protein [Bacteroidota bacterium]